MSLQSAPIAQFIQPHIIGDEQPQNDPTVVEEFLIFWIPSLYFELCFELVQKCIKCYYFY